MAAAACSAMCRAAPQPAGSVVGRPSRSGRACRRAAVPTVAGRSSSSSVGERREQQHLPDGGGSRRELLAAAAALAASLSLQRAAWAEGAVPKGYVDTARKLVDALREAISTDLSDAEEREVRRAADPAKSLVKEFLTRWKGNPLVAGEPSYAELTSAIQQLGAFYQANGQRARLTPEAGQAVLDALDAAEAALPTREEVKALLPFF